MTARRALFVISTRGQGHIVRCRALAAELLTRGWFSTMTNRSPLSGTSYDVSIVDLGDEEHAAAVYDALKDRPVVAIVDTPGPRLVDMIVCGSPGAKVEMFAPEPEGASAGTILGGGAYALLRPEFREVSWGQHGFSSSHDVFDLRTVERESAESLARIMAASRLVVTWGGMRAMEAACVGVPMICVSRDENAGEMQNVHGLWKAGAAWWWEGYDHIQKVDELVAAGADLQVMSMVGRGLVDGLGCKRVADAIEELVK